MRPVGDKTFRFDNLPNDKSHPATGGAGRPSRILSGSPWPERAASAGFVLSMIFLAAAAIYALSLSGALGRFASEIVTRADRAAFDAGYRLEDLTVSGSQNTPRAVLLDSLKLPYSKSSLYYDTLEARDRLLRLGWVQAAEVRLILPSRLEVLISERVPFARWADSANSVQLIDREGHVLGPVGEERFETLLLFSGEGAPPEAAAFAEALSDHEGIKRRIDRIEMIAERFWQVKLDNGILVKLPRKVNELVLERLESLLLSPRVAELGLETIDLRLSHRTILQLREATAANRDRAIASLTSWTNTPWPAPRRGKAL